MHNSATVRNKNFLKKTVCAFFLGLLVTSSAWAEDVGPTKVFQGDITKLTIEELMNIEVLRGNVLGTHTHLAGEWMIGYKQMFMKMDGNRDGTNRKSTSEVLTDFMVAPLDMTMQMHMLDVMYAPTDNLTLMAMLPYVRLSMDHVTRTGARFTTRSEGVGDFQMNAHYTLYGDARESGHRLLINAGLSFPTGSIDEKDDTPSGRNQKLPYPMQLGSGTFDLLPGLTYLGESENWAWMGQVMGTIRLGENDNHYTLGNRLGLNSWVSRKITDWLALSVRMDGDFWGNIDGADPDLIPSMVPTADPNRRGGKRVDLSFGINLYVPRGVFSGNRVAIEAGFPIFQSLDGPQLEKDFHLRIGWSWTF